MNKTIKYDMAEAMARYGVREHETDCNCETRCDQECGKMCVTTAFPENPVPAMAYIPFQLDKSSYTAEMALREGTLFPVLNKPFCGRSVL